jgi:hypothetical protein
LAGSLPSRPTELDIQQKAPPYEEETRWRSVFPSRLKSNNGVCVRKITLQRVMSDEKKKSFQYVKIYSIGHFTVPESIVGFNAP